MNIISWMSQMSIQVILLSRIVGLYISEQHSGDEVWVLGDQSVQVAQWPIVCSEYLAFNFDSGCWWCDAKVAHRTSCTALLAMVGLAGMQPYRLLRRRKASTRCWSANFMNPLDAYNNLATMTALNMACNAVRLIPWARTILSTCKQSARCY